MHVTYAMENITDTPVNFPTDEEDKIVFKKNLCDKIVANILEVLHVAVKRQLVKAGIACAN